MGYRRYDVTKGPKRWVRAENNARLRPHTKAAKLYGARVLVAEQAASLASLGELPGITEHQPFEFLGGEYYWQDGARQIREPKPEFRTCSVRCTVLQATVDRSVETLEEAVKLLKGETFTKRREYTYIPTGQTEETTRVNTWEVKPNLRPLDRTTLTRNVRCMCCGVTITKKESEQPAAPAPVQTVLPEVIHMPCTQEHVQRTDHVISARGNAIETADRVWVVSLTPREKQILELVTDKTVIARQLGTPLSLVIAVAQSQDA